MRIGITGHMHLSPSTVDLVREALTAELAQYDAADLVGISCLAEGTDSIFAQAILDVGGRLVALVPAPDYRDTRVCGEDPAAMASVISPDSSPPQARGEPQTSTSSGTVTPSSPHLRRCWGQLPLPSGQSALTSHPAAVNGAVGSDAALASRMRLHAYTSTPVVVLGKTLNLEREI